MTACTIWEMNSQPSSSVWPHCPALQPQQAWDRSCPRVAEAWSCCLSNACSLARVLQWDLPSPESLKTTKKKVLVKPTSPAAQSSHWKGFLGSPPVQISTSVFRGVEGSQQGGSGHCRTSLEHSKPSTAAACRASSTIHSAGLCLSSGQSTAPGAPLV